MTRMRKGQLSIALVCVVLGIMLAVQFRATQGIRSNVTYQRIEDLSAQLKAIEQERDGLLEEVHALRQKSGGSKEIQNIKMGAGIVDLRGPGVVVTIDDSQKIAKAGENPNLYVIHDDDLLKIINELRAAGAEAISVNGQRLIATSEIRCAGPTLSVNNTRYTPPYEILAIGDSKTLDNALKMRGGIVETLRFWGIQVSITKTDNIVVPAYKSSFRFDYAKPIDKKEGGAK
ncbi:MAG: DUF881 domain-containing protein [Selenomonadales bacterium]|nr:DUF881 domain-containing protein [Selenomonadales bacterium]